MANPKPQAITAAISGGAIAFLPLVIQLLDSVTNSGVLPPQWAAAISGLGGLLALLAGKKAKQI